MRLQKWIVINSRGHAKLAVKEPRLTVNEIAFRLHLEIPDAIFKRPMILADIVIPRETVLPDKITVDMTNNIEEAIKSVTGLEMRVSVVEPPDEG